MTTYLMNSLPNSLLFSVLEKGATLTEVTPLTVAFSIGEPNYSADYDGETPPIMWEREGVVSAVGHESTVELFEQVLERAVGATYCGEPLVGATGSLKIPFSEQRLTVVPEAGDTLYCGLLCSQARLEKSRLYTEEELLALPLRWLKVQF